MNQQIVSTYLIKKYDLWLWDWDDTLIDTTTYYVQSMEPRDIAKRTIKEFGEEEALPDLVWTLMNAHEFLFLQ